MVSVELDNEEIGMLLNILNQVSVPLVHAKKLLDLQDKLGKAVTIKVIEKRENKK